MRTGWIKIHRRMLDWEWYQDANTVRMFLHILLKANHAACGGIKRGSFATSLYILAKELNISLRAVRTSLDHLVSTNEITVESTKKGTIIAVNNYSKYQTSVAKLNTSVTKSTQKTTQKTTQKMTQKKKLSSLENIEQNKSDTFEATQRATQKATQKTTTNKKIKNIKNINNKNIHADAWGSEHNVFLSNEEYQKLIDKAGKVKADAAIEYLSLYIAEKDYKSKSHYLAICRWVLKAVHDKPVRKVTTNKFHNFEEREDDLDDFTFKKSLELLKG